MKTKAKSKAKTKNEPKSEPTKVLVLRTCDANMRSRSGQFQWASVGEITVAPDWSPAKECGNGLHGWLWGSGDWSLKEKGQDVTWLVIEVDADKVVDLDGKVKFPSGRTLAVEKTWNAAMGFIRGYASFPQGDNVATGDYGHASATGYSGHASATGDYGHASATGNHGHASATGYSGHASATGDYGHASATGNHGHASATGYSGHASATGNHGHASATGYSGHASATGYSGWAVAGHNGNAKAGQDGCVTIAFRDGKRMRVVVGYVGEDGIKADTMYCVVKGKLKEVE
jgi:hypothetical protein